MWHQSLVNRYRSIMVLDVFSLVWVSLISFYWCMNSHSSLYYHYLSCIKRMIWWKWWTSSGNLSETYYTDDSLLDSDLQIVAVGIIIQIRWYYQSFLTPTNFIFVWHRFLSWRRTGKTFDHSTSSPPWEDHSDCIKYIASGFG